MSATNLQINAERLWETIQSTAAFGGTPKGGIKRLAGSDEDAAMRGWFVAACEAAGCTVSVDEMGNIFARREGARGAAPPIVFGSHLDTQPTGGKFDGILGVLAGLEVLRTLKEAGYQTERALELVDWTNEEGARFAPAMLASGVFAGVYTPEFGASRADRDGITLGAELERIGYKGAAPCRPRPVAAYLELHIEQGPVLENEARTIGVVTGVQGVRWFDITITGEEAHAGPTPMPSRRDALLAASQVVSTVNGIAMRRQPDAVATVGRLEVDPCSRNVIPGVVRLTVDIRNPDLVTLNAMEAELRACLAGLGDSFEVAIETVYDSAPVAFDPTCMDAVRSAAEARGLKHRDLVSGAGHDAAYMARICPVGMVFIPCERGISHNEAESATFEDVAAGANVLLDAILAVDRSLPR